MRKSILKRRLRLKVPRDSLFAWFERPGIFERLMPPWQRVQSFTKMGNVPQRGSRIAVRILCGPFAWVWMLVHSGFKKNRSFKAYQKRGPFSYWTHEHTFEAISEKESLLEDRIEYRLPWLLLWFKPFLKRRLKRLMRYQHEIIKQDFSRPLHQRAVAPLKIVIAGVTGFIGSQLRIFLLTQGHTVIGLARRADLERNIYEWDPEKGLLDSGLLEGADAVINLCGSSILCRWSKENKERIINSRLLPTKLLVEVIQGLSQKPSVFINASGIAIYGATKSSYLHEESSIRQTGFLAELCKQWEETTHPLALCKTRVILFRFGAVLSPAGGILRYLYPLFLLGLGGRLGSGLQAMSWISMDDVVAAIHFCMLNDAICGPVNGTTNNPVTNFRFKQTLAKAVNRVAWIPIPEWVVKRVWGQMSQETVLASQRIYPKKLIKYGFRFHYPTLESALKHLLP